MTHDKIYYGLSIMIALTFTAIFSMTFFHEGTAMSKYFAHQSELERVKEVEVTNYSDMVLFGDASEPSPLDVDLTEEAGSETGFQRMQTIRHYDQSAILLLMVASWAMLIPAVRKYRAFAHIYLVMGIYLLLLSYYKGVNGGAMFSELSIPAHATRWLPCFALWGWLAWTPKIKERQMRLTTWLLVIATSLTFSIHGHEAIMINPRFVDLLYGVFERFSIPLSETVCHTLLWIIGLMDVIFAVLILWVRKKSLLLWMAVWGALTAFSRPLAFGFIFWEESLLRIGNCLVPLAVMALIILKHRTNTRHEVTISS
jgi:hypothetical protein